MRECTRLSVRKERRIRDERIPVGVLMLLQGSVTSVSLIWPGIDMSGARDFACPRARESPPAHHPRLDSNISGE